MKKQISYGINHTFSLEQQKYFILKYKDYIKSVYCPLPDKELAHYTSDLHKYLTNNFINSYYEIFIDFLKCQNIKLNFTLNSTNFNKLPVKKQDDVINYIYKYNPDEICCSDKYFYLLKDHYNTTYLRTILQGVLNPKEYNSLPAYNGYMLRTTYPFEYKLPKDKECRIMIDFACHLTCHASPCNCQKMHSIKKNNPYYVEVFENEMKLLNNSFEKYLAHHLFLGRDTELLENLYSNTTISYKYASRMHNIKSLAMGTSTLNSFSIAFDNYIQRSNQIEFSQKLMSNMCNGCGFTEWMHECYDWTKFNKDLFYEEKLNWWKKLIPNLDKY